MREYIINKVKDHIRNSLAIDNPKVQVPKNPSFGHLTTNVALELGAKDKDLNQSTLLVKSALEKMDYVQRVDITDRGFVNIWLNDWWVYRAWENYEEKTISLSQISVDKSDNLTIKQVYEINYCYARIKGIVRVLGHSGIERTSRYQEDLELTEKDLSVVGYLIDLYYNIINGKEITQEDILSIVEEFHQYRSLITNNPKDKEISFRLSVIDTIAHIIKTWCDKKGIELTDRM